MSNIKPLKYYNLEYESNQNGGDQNNGDQNDGDPNNDEEINQNGGEAELNENDVTRFQQMSLYNDKNLNYMEPSKTTLFTIPKGSLLYHGSLNKESFNPYDIRLGDDKLVSYFSPNKRLAADYIVGCALYPNKAGFLHKFRVKKDIEKILIISTHEKQAHWTLSFIEDSFCSRKFRIQLDGIGFFFARRDEKDFTAIQQGDNSVKNLAFDSEFAICNPNEFLEYVSSQRCQSVRKLTDDYHFSK
jgi:hypothetical protein